MNWMRDVQTVGICGATSTPKWLMEECRDYILDHIGGKANNVIE